MEGPFPRILFKKTCGIIGMLITLRGEEKEPWKYIFLSAQLVCARTSDLSLCLVTYYTAVCYIITIKMWLAETQFCWDETSLTGRAAAFSRKDLSLLQLSLSERCIVCVFTFGLSNNRVNATSVLCWIVISWLVYISFNNCVARNAATNTADSLSPLHLCIYYRSTLNI